MRQRRGNYSILFSLTAAIMLSYLAFSIDGGRMTVAAVQAENAAEAATLAALLTIKEGGTRLEAEDAGRLAANKVRMQRLRPKANDNEPDFTISFNWGEWDWEAARTSLDSRWSANNNLSQSVTANARVTSGAMVNVFGPAIAMLRTQGQPYGSRPDSGDFSTFDVRQGARAAVRNRDMVVVVDVSRYSEDQIALIQNALTTFVGDVDDNNVPGDRMALVAYAGEAFTYDLLDPVSLTVNGTDSGVGINAAGGQQADRATMVEPADANALYRLDGVAATVQATVGSVEVCDVSSDSFFNTVRYTPPIFDPEFSQGWFSDAESSFNYYLISSRPQEGGFARIVSSADGGFTNWELTDAGVDVRDFITGLMMLNASAGGFLNLTDNLRTHPCNVLCADPIWGPVDPTTGFVKPECQLTGVTLPAGTPVPEDAAGFFTCVFNQNGGALPPDFQCAAWNALHLWYLRFDPRRQRARNSSAGSPLACHDGNWYEGDPNRISTFFPVPNHSCLAYEGRPDPTTTPQAHADQSYFMAGSNPGAGLRRAADILTAKQSNGENTVVLISSSRPRCGPLVEADSAVATTCRNALIAEAAGALRDLETLEANVYVIGLVDAGSPDEGQLSLWSGIGRGYYDTVADATGLANALSEIASDVRLQVVR